VSDEPFRLLFVCTANICRSAYADVLTRHLVAGTGASGPAGDGAGDGPNDGTVSVPGGGVALEVGSAGTHGFVDQPMDPPMATRLSARGADPSGFRSRPLTMAMVQQADLVLTAQVAHRQYILDERPELFRRVLTLGQLDRILAAVDTRATGRDLLAALRPAFIPASPDDDVADPFGRGEEAAGAAAERIDALVGRVVGRLTGQPAP
jgi:protein-tyrosine-phosphatase